MYSIKVHNKKKNMYLIKEKFRLITRLMNIKIVTNASKGTPVYNTLTPSFKSCKFGYQVTSDGVSP